MRSDAKIRELARQLRLDSRGDCVRRLREYALEKVRKWTETLAARSANQLLELVAGFLSLRIVFIRAEEDIERMAEEYVPVWPTLDRQLRAEFINGTTLGCVLSHPKPQPGDLRYIAFIDARGENAFRAYFTAWHEVAHLLLQPQQLSFSGFRRVTDLPLSEKKDSIEALVDQVAGDLAFYYAFAEPAIDTELARTGQLTLDGISRIRDAVAPNASFSAAAHHVVALSQQPAAFMVADLALKPSEARWLAGPQMTFVEFAQKPEPKLRAVSVFLNEAAKAAGLEVFRHMRVPPDSVIAKVYEGVRTGPAISREDQGAWETSAGGRLPPLPLRVEAAKFGPVVYALLFPK